MCSAAAIVLTLAACGGGEEAHDAQGQTLGGVSPAQVAASATQAVGSEIAALPSSVAVDPASQAQDGVAMASDTATASVALALLPVDNPTVSMPDAAPSGVVPATTATPVSTAAMAAWNRDWPLPHEAKPLGVPTSFDWYAKGRIGAGNAPPNGFAAMIGWGQVFWARNAVAGTATVEIRNLHTYVCAGTERRWVRLAGSEVTGAVFRPDYANNNAVAPLATSLNAGVRSTTFNTEGAYHFWPVLGRASIPAGTLCGIVVMVEARAASGSPSSNSLLLGVGGDYWLTKTASWDNYTTNKDWAVGRLKLLTSSWRWYGMSTAAESDLSRLNSVGFTEGAR